MCNKNDDSIKLLNEVLKWYDNNIFTGTLAELMLRIRHHVANQEEKPYIETHKTVTILAYNPKYGDGRVCEQCGHSYYRHFDPYAHMEPEGCKYCGCVTFSEKKGHSTDEKV